MIGGEQVSDDATLPGPSTRMFQIREDDLATLEQVLPNILSDCYPHLNSRLRTWFRQVQRIVVNVRWNYGPPREVMEIAFDANPEESTS